MRGVNARRHTRHLRISTSTFTSIRLIIQENRYTFLEFIPCQQSYPQSNPHPRHPRARRITIFLCGRGQVISPRASICRRMGKFVRGFTLERLYVPPSGLGPRLTRRPQGLTIGREVLRRVSRRWRYSCSSISPRAKRSPSTSSAAVVRKVADRPPPVK